MENEYLLRDSCDLYENPLVTKDKNGKLKLVGAYEKSYSKKEAKIMIAYEELRQKQQKDIAEIEADFDDEDDYRESELPFNQEEEE